MDVLHRLERTGIIVINSPSSIERSIDKYYALTLLEESGIPVPRTIGTENINEAMKAFYELSEDVIVKPIFGSRGIGSARISDPDIAFRVFRAILFSQGVLYIQEFIPHGSKDIRVFVIGNKVFASMYRVADSWKTNISKGAKPIFLKLKKELKELAIKAAKSVGVEITGVDILEGKNGPVIIELNSQPGWKGLQSVINNNIADEIIRYTISKIT
jgi:RimK family alpha-L-glutamate ligase